MKGIQLISLLFSAFCAKLNLASIYSSETTLNEIQSSLTKGQRLFLERIESLSSTVEEVKSNQDELLLNTLDKLAGISEEIKSLSNKFEEKTCTQNCVKCLPQPCGGILVAESGRISLQYLESGSFNQSIDQSINQSISRNFTSRCIWTVRAGRKSLIEFSLRNNGILGPNAFLTLTPMKPYIVSKNDLTAVRQSVVTITSESWGTYKVEGPIVFVTLWTRTSQIPLSFSLGFDLIYEGVGPDHKDYALTKFSHYHYTSLEGTIDYPQMIGKTNYSPNEIATFVINPGPPSAPNFKVKLISLNLENSTSCENDSLTPLTEKAEGEFFYYTQSGRKGSDHRYCGEEGTINEDLNFNQSYPILVFKSNEGAESKGFKLQWTQP